MTTVIVQILAKQCMYSYTDHSYIGSSLLLEYDIATVYEISN